MHSILIIEDDPCLGQTLAKLFTDKTYQTTICTNINSSYKFLEVNNPDLVIADRLLPDGDGIEIVEFLKDCSYKTKVLMLSSKCDVENRVEGLQIGADDYLNKPFSSQELLLRVNSLLCKTKNTPQNFIEIGDMKLFYDKGQLEINNENKKIRKKEAELLHCLFIHHGQVVTRQQLTDWIWGCSNEIPTRAAIDVYVKRIRTTLGKYRKYLQTVRGYGYRLKLPVN